MRQSLRLDFSVIENFESMQIINNKRKYKIQQLFKMLSLSLDTCLKSFSPLVFYWPCQRWSIGSQPQTLTTIAASVQVAYWLLVYVPEYVVLHGAIVAMETAQLALNPYQAFKFSNAVNAQLNADASSVKIIHNGTILMKLYQPVLEVRFFETQCRKLNPHCVSKKFPPLYSV